jgi:hypothetical protein
LGNAKAIAPKRECPNAAWTSCPRLGKEILKRQAKEKAQSEEKTEAFE